MAKKQGAVRTKSVPENETKRQRFERLGSARMAKAIKAIRGIGNLSGVGYEYTENDVRLINDTFKREINAMLSRFAPSEPGAKPGVEFSFVQSPQA